ncbi:hypothetical protein [Streptomyces collinus]
MNGIQAQPPYPYTTVHLLFFALYVLFALYAPVPRPVRRFTRGSGPR